MAFWNRNDDERRNDSWRERDFGPGDRDSRFRDDEHRWGHRGDNDRAQSAERYGYGASYGEMGMGRPRFGEHDRQFGAHHGNWRDEIGGRDFRSYDRVGAGYYGGQGRGGYRNDLGQSYGGGHWGGSDYGVRSTAYGSENTGWRGHHAPGNWNHGGNWNQGFGESWDDRHFRSDMPGMGPRGDYGMDDPRHIGTGMGGNSGMGGNYGSGIGNVSGLGTGWGPSRDSSLMSGERMSNERMTGRGPRTYNRSDARIKEDICDRLMQGWMNAEDVDVRVENGEVTLTGECDNRHEKRAIEDLSETVLGVRDVHNHLKVRKGIMSKLGLTRSDEQDRTSASNLPSGVATGASVQTGANTGNRNTNTRV